MSSALTALKTKLSWKIQEIQKEIEMFNFTIEEQAKSLDGLLKTIQDACKIPSKICPEQEVARLNFTLRQREQYEQLFLKNKEYQETLERLNTQKLRLKTELKVLEKYQDREQQKERLINIKVQNNALDEWALR